MKPLYYIMDLTKYEKWMDFVVRDHLVSILKILLLLFDVLSRL